MTQLANAAYNGTTAPQWLQSRNVQSTPAKDTADATCDQQLMLCAST